MRNNNSNEQIWINVKFIILSVIEKQKTMKSYSSSRNTPNRALDVHWISSKHHTISVEVFGWNFNY